MPDLGTEEETAKRIAKTNISNKFSNEIDNFNEIFRDKFDKFFKDKENKLNKLKNNVKKLKKLC